MLHDQFYGPLSGVLWSHASTGIESGADSKAFRSQLWELLEFLNLLDLTSCSVWWNGSTCPTGPPPHTSRGLLYQAMPCDQSNLKKGGTQVKPVLVYPAFSFLLYQLPTPCPVPNNPFHQRFGGPVAKWDLSPITHPHLSWGTHRVGIRSCWLLDQTINSVWLITDFFSL